MIIREGKIIFAQTHFTILYNLTLQLIRSQHTQLFLLMKTPTPKTLSKVMSDKHTKYEAVKYLKPKGKRGQTFKGLLTKVRKL